LRKLLRSQRTLREVCLRRRAVLPALAMAALLAAGSLRTPGQDTKPAAVPPATTPPAQHEEVSPPDIKSQTVRVRVDVVNVPVTVLNKRGLPVIDLTKDDFQLFEDGVQQNIRYFNRETQLPLLMGLIMDTSNSARSQLTFEKDAAIEFAFTMLQGRSSKNQIFVQTYDAQSSVVQDFTNDPDLLNEKIQELKAGGGKALYDAIFSACREKMMKAGNPEENRRVLVVISDGLDVQSTHTIEEAISMARRAETMIYTIGNAAYGYTNTGDVNLVKMADATGGAPFFPLRTSPGADMGTGYISHGTIGETSQNKGLGAETGTYSAQRGIQLADALEAISRQLNEQYNLGYTPARTALDGTYRTIRVESTHRNMTMRWKPGYFAAVE
jgi:Ca-activated chloride channel family protein